MLPFDQKRKQGSVMAPGGDSLEGAAMEQAMSRFINAVQAGNVTEAVSCWKTLCELGDTDY
jgi:hypothetical protein